MKGFFITGTDTGVGKTIIAGALIKTLCFLGLKTGAMKPVESGCVRKGKVLIPSDGMFLKQISHMPESITQVTPCCFESPLAPYPASVIERKSISVAGIKKAFYRLSAHYNAVIVEGVGGLMVPLRKNYFVVRSCKADAAASGCCCKTRTGINKPYHADGKSCLKRGSDGSGYYHQLHASA